MWKRLIFDKFLEKPCCCILRFAKILKNVFLEYRGNFQSSGSFTIFFSLTTITIVVVLIVISSSCYLQLTKSLHKMLLFQSYISNLHLCSFSILRKTFSCSDSWPNSHFYSMLDLNLRMAFRNDFWKRKLKKVSPDLLPFSKL